MKSHHFPTKWERHRFQRVKKKRVKRKTSQVVELCFQERRLSGRDHVCEVVMYRKMSMTLAEVRWTMQGAVLELARLAPTIRLPRCPRPQWPRSSPPREWRTGEPRHSHPGGRNTIPRCYPRNNKRIAKVMKQKRKLPHTLCSLLCVCVSLSLFCDSFQSTFIFIFYFLMFFFIIIFSWLTKRIKFVKIWMNFVVCCIADFMSWVYIIDFFLRWKICKFSVLKSLWTLCFQLFQLYLLLTWNCDVKLFPIVRGAKYINISLENKTQINDDCIYYTCWCREL